MWSDLVLATNKGAGVVRAVLALSIHLLVMAKVSPAVVTLGVAARAVMSPSSCVYQSRAALLRYWVVGFFPTKSVDASLVAEEETGVIRVEATALCMASTNSSHNMTFAAFEKEVWDEMKMKRQYLAQENRRLYSGKSSENKSIVQI